MKKISLLLIAALLVSLFAGCAGTPVVYYTNCTCPTGTVIAAPEGESVQSEPAPYEGALKTGLSILTSVSKSKNGTADFDVTIVAVTVDETGVIRGCSIDSLGTGVSFDDKGVITTDLGAQLQTKNEKGEAYGMKAAGSSYEWNEQAAAVAAYAVDKTVDQLKNGAVDEAGMAADADLASVATIKIGGYVAGIEAAAANASYLGATEGDALKLAVTASLGKSAGATAEADGVAQLDLTATALTMKDGVITSCAIDAVQAKVGFNAAGELTGDVSAPVPTKNELGDAYNMVTYGKAKAEWNVQAASFAEYVTGKTPADVAGIHVDEGYKATDADLTASVTISIGDFLTLIAKAAQA